MSVIISTFDLATLLIRSFTVQSPALELDPPSRMDQFCEDRPTESAIKAFAERLGIHAGIVLGRLQNQGILPWNRLNHVKGRYSWQD